MIDSCIIQVEGATTWTDPVTPRVSDWITRDDDLVREALIYVGGPTG